MSWIHRVAPLLLLLPLAACGGASDEDPAVRNPLPPPSREVLELRGRVDGLEKARAGLREEVAGLRGTLERAGKENAGLAAEVEALRAEADRRAADVEALALRVALLEKRIEEGAGAGGGEPPPPPAARRNCKGVVLAADPRMDIYIVSVGEQDGVETGDELTVYRSDQFVAVVVVDKVFQDKASAIVKRVDGKPFLKSEIRQGDKVARVF